jgi:hypothetical protein
LLARVGPNEDSGWVNLSKIDFDDADNANLVTADFDLKLEADHHASVLVGDVMGWAHDQALVVKPTPDHRTTVAIYGQQSGDPDIVCVRLHQCDTDLSSAISSLVIQAGGPGPAPDLAP